MKKSNHRKMEERRIIMRKRVVTLMTMVAMLCSAVAPGMEISAAQAKAGAAGTTYYVSTLHGKDTNSGTSEDAPFYSLQKINHLDLGPGDKILLECGSVFTGGYLHLFGQSGSADEPIVIDRYGTGEDPIIDTNGQGVWFQNYGQRLDNTWHQYQGYVSSSILLYDSEYVEIQNLEIVNNNPEIDTVYNAVDMMDRTGVAAVAQDKGTIDHIHLKNLNIHDVIGNVYNKHMNNGGIYFTVYLPHDAQMTNKSDNKGDFVSSGTGVARFDDVLIDGCSVINTNRWGIAVGYTALWDEFSDMEISDETIAKYGSTNVVIRNNYVKDAGGDSITLMYCDRPLVEYNVSDGAARQMHAGDYGPQGEMQRFAAGIWPWKCKDAVFQYNECFDTKNVNNDNGDGQAWDADWSDGTIYQYNYSHHNGGGCLMVCLNQAYRTTFRYNISQNDLRSVLDTFGSPKAHIYNNTFYVAEGVPIYRDRSGGEALLENNIFYYSGETAKEENWTVGNNKTYSNNLYYNYANTPTDEAGVTVAKGTKVFEDAGTGPAAPFKTGQAREHEDPEAANVFDGYKLSANSPAIGKGKAVEDANGYEPSGVDFFGNDLTGVSAFDIGANQYHEETGDGPKKPSKPMIGDAAADTVQISWTAPLNAGDIKGYKIKDGDTVLKDLTGSELAAADGREISIQLEKLTAGKQYTLTVVAYDENGRESSPQTISFQTATAPQEENTQKPSMPAQPSVSGISQTGATVSWTAASGEEVTGYKIQNGSTVLLNLTGQALANATSGNKITAKIAGLKAGTAYTLSLIATNKNGDSAARTFTFKTAAAPVLTPSVRLSQTSLTLYTKVKTSATLTATKSNFSGAVTWTSSNPSVAAVSNGKVTAKKAGTTVITAAAGSAKATCTVTVKKPSIKVKKSVSVKKGKKVKLKVTATPKGKITYKSSKKKIASVTKKGVVKGVKKGSCKITVSCNGVKTTVKVKVK